MYLLIKSCDIIMMSTESLSNKSFGICSICGRRKGTHSLKVSDDFVSYSELYPGKVVCDVCNKLLRDPQYRKSHWILTGDEIRTLSKEELMKILEDPPINSLVYIKSAGRKYGFLHALRFSSTSAMAALAGEDEGAILVPRERLKHLIGLAKEAYSTFRKKTPLLEGCSPNDWVHRELCEQIGRVRGEMAWRAVVRAL
jgi:hypothetical protein